MLQAINNTWDSFSVAFFHHCNTKQVFKERKRVEALTSGPDWSESSAQGMEEKCFSILQNYCGGDSVEFEDALVEFVGAKL